MGDYGYRCDVARWKTRVDYQGGFRVGRQSRSVEPRGVPWTWVLHAGRECALRNGVGGRVVVWDRTAANEEGVRVGSSDEVRRSK